MHNEVSLASRLTPKVEVVGIQPTAPNRNDAIALNGETKIWQGGCCGAQKGECCKSQRAFARTRTSPSRDSSAYFKWARSWSIRQEGADLTDDELVESRLDSKKEHSPNGPLALAAGTAAFQHIARIVIMARFACGGHRAR